MYNPGSQVLRTNSKHASYLSVFFSLPPSRPDPISPAAQSTPRQTVRSFSACRGRDPRYPKTAHQHSSFTPPTTRIRDKTHPESHTVEGHSPPFSCLLPPGCSCFRRAGLVTAAEATLCSELARVLQKTALVPAMGLRVDRQR